MLYVHLCSCHTINHWSISFIICCRKNQSSTQTWGIQHAMRVLSLSEKYAGSKPKDLWPWPFVASSPFWDSLPQCTAQVRHGCLERLKSTQLKSPHSWPLHVKSTSTQIIAKHPLFSKDMETTWKKTQLCYFSDYLHFTLWNCPWYLYQHSPLSMSRSWVTIPYRSIYRLIPNGPMPPTIDRERCFLLTASSLTATSTYELFDGVGLGPRLFWFCLNHFIMLSPISPTEPSVTLMVYSTHKVSICPRMLGIIDS